MRKNIWNLESIPEWSRTILFLIVPYMSGEVKKSSLSCVTRLSPSALKIPPSVRGLREKKNRRDVFSSPNTLHRGLPADFFFLVETAICLEVSLKKKYCKMSEEGDFWSWLTNLQVHFLSWLIFLIHTSIFSVIELFLVKVFNKKQNSMWFCKKQGGMFCKQIILFSISVLSYYKYRYLLELIHTTEPYLN